MKYFVILITLIACSKTPIYKKEVYNRKDFKHWIDADGDCQNTRDEVLVRDSINQPKFKTKRSCKVIAGKWFDPYSNKYFYQAHQIDIDHVVPLSHAFYHGANTWNSQLKLQFANDEENLLSVSGKENKNKGDKPPHQWLPSAKTFHCQYIEKWIFIKQKYKLDITVSEADFLNKKRKNCP